MEVIKNRGVYVSEPFHWVDWHAGTKFEGNNFYVIRFENNKCFFDTISKKEEISIQNMLENESFGFYKTEEHILEIKYNPDSEFEIKRTFTILSSEILLDENLKEYRFTENV